VRLLAAKAKVDSRDTDGMTPLTSASCNGHPIVVTILLAAGANPELRDLVGWTPLDWASQNGHETVIKLLKESCKPADWFVKWPHSVIINSAGCRPFALD
jgi:ankyrin repeat protein